MRLIRLSALYGAELALSNQPLAKVRKQGKVVAAEEAGEGNLVARPGFPVVVRGH